MPSDIDPTLPHTSSLVEVRVAGTTEARAVVEAIFSLGSLGIQEIGAEIVTYLPDSL